jgi:hypothetical protein
MKAKRLVGAALLPALLACGCASLSNTEKGVGAGGLIGAGTGALIGNSTGHTGAGAAIGAGVGALSGGLVGNAIDRSERKAEAQIAAATAPGPNGPLGLTDVVQMAQAHVSDQVIISQIRSTGSVFHLSANDTIWLKQNGVSDPVIHEMLATANRSPVRACGARPVYVRPVYVEPAWGYNYGRGYGWGWGGCGW